MKFFGGFFGNNKKHRPKRLTKNKQYLAMKRERLQNELAEIARAEQAGGRVAMFAQSGIMHTEGTQEARALKEYQRDLLGWIERADVKTLYDRLQERRVKLCPACQTSLIDSIPRCDRDFYNFVYCDMIFQALGLNFTEQGLEVPK